MNNDTQNIPNMNDHFIRYKKRYFKLSIISAILFVIFLPITVVYWFKVDAIQPHYQIVSVYVERVFDSKIGNEVKVTYENEIYDLINVNDSELYIYRTSKKLGKPVEVLLGDDGKLYSNEDGIRTNNVTGYLYFTFLGFTLLFLCATPVLIGCVVEANKREKGIYPKGYNHENNY